MIPPDVDGVEIFWKLVERPVDAQRANALAHTLQLRIAVARRIEHLIERLSP